MTLLEDFARIFQLPLAMLPHIEFVAQPQEIALVVALGDGPLAARQIAEKLIVRSILFDDVDNVLEHARLADAPRNGHRLSARLRLFP